jgi:hypothetical protein
MTCATCRYFESKKSECRINAPVSAWDGYKLTHGWPKVMSYNACGQHTGGRSLVCDEDLKIPERIRHTLVPGTDKA